MSAESANAVTAPAEPRNTREPSFFASCENPNRCVMLNRGGPTSPRWVVMITTPLLALAPYTADAEAPFRTSTFSMSNGFRSAIRFTWPCCNGDVFEPLFDIVTTCWLLGIAASLTITPSTTYRGDWAPNTDVTPRKATCTPPPGAPEFV